MSTRQEKLIKAANVLKSAKLTPGGAILRTMLCTGALGGVTGLIGSLAECRNYTHIDPYEHIIYPTLGTAFAGGLSGFLPGLLLVAPLVHDAQKKAASNQSKSTTQAPVK